MLSELRKLPDDVLSIREATSQVRIRFAPHIKVKAKYCETLESNYTGLDADLSALTHYIKADLTPALSKSRLPSHEKGEY